MGIILILQIFFVVILLKESLSGNHKILASVVLFSCVGGLLLSHIGLDIKVIPYTLFIIWVYAITLKILNRKNSY